MVGCFVGVEWWGGTRMNVLAISDDDLLDVLLNYLSLRAGIDLSLNKFSLV